MEDQEAAPEIYLAEHLREALAQDPRVGELGIAVEIEGDSVVLSGTMTSPEQQDAAVAIAHHFLPGHQVRVETTAGDLPEPTESEHLP
jgi:osmotically-inducible protein OsmY